MTTVEHPAGRAQRGRNTFSARALQRVTVGVAKDAAQLSSRDVTVSLADDSGSLRVAVALPAVIAASTITEQGECVRAGVIQGLEDLAGRRVSAVDIRFSGVKQAAQRRVS